MSESRALAAATRRAHPACSPRPSALALLVGLLLGTSIALQAQAPPRPVTPLAHPDDIQVQLDTSKYGSLDQGQTNCPDFGCGPTAAVNSFTFLQNAYPNNYRNSVGSGLIGDPPNGPKDAADALLNYMGTQCTVGAPCGTFWQNFITGKQRYVDEVSLLVGLSQTFYGAMSAFTWDPGNGGGNTPKPDYVTDKTTPTVKFLGDKLRGGADVELLLTFRVPGQRPYGHWVTLTGITYDGATKMGTISYVDPLDGEDATDDIEIGADGAIHLTYNGLEEAIITVGVSEEPNTFQGTTPEPTTFVCVGGGLLLLLALRQTRRRRPE